MIFRRRRREAGPPIAYEEAMRILRSNFLVAIADLPEAVVAITSSNAREGKTSTCVALAQSLASLGRRVVLVDLDLRQPNAHNALDAAASPGATEVLRNTVAAADALQFIEVGPDRGFYFLPAGEATENPSELLSSERTARLLDLLSQQADIVLIDTPPVLPVADTLVIGRLAAGALLVVQAGQTSAHVAQRSKDALISNQCRILGLVVNRLRASEDDYDYPTLVTPGR